MGDPSVWKVGLGHKALCRHLPDMTDRNTQSKLVVVRYEPHLRPTELSLRSVSGSNHHGTKPSNARQHEVDRPTQV
jgi:hypothetical protein